MYFYFTFFLSVSGPSSGPTLHSPLSLFPSLARRLVQPCRKPHNLWVPSGRTPSTGVCLHTPGTLDQTCPVMQSDGHISGTTACSRAAHRIKSLGRCTAPSAGRDTGIATYLSMAPLSPNPNTSQAPGPCMQKVL